MSELKEQVECEGKFCGQLHNKALKAGMLQRLEFLRDYFNGDKPITVIMHHRQIVELLDSIIKDASNDR